MDKYQLIKLSNGIPVLLLPQEHTRAVSLFVTAKVGSRYESPKISGISHFIEHLMFKGTKKRPDKEMLAKELDSIGANLTLLPARIERFILLLPIINTWHKFRIFWPIWCRPVYFRKKNWLRKKKW